MQGDRADKRGGGWMHGTRVLACLAAALACAAAPAAPPRRAASEPIRPVTVPAGSDPRQAVIGDIDFRQLPMYQAARLASELTRVNVVSTAAAAEVPVTLFLRHTTVQALMDNLARVSGLWYRFDKETNTYLLMTAEEFRRDVVVYRSDATRVFPMKYYNVVSAATALRALYGKRVRLSASVEEPLGISALGSPLSARRTSNSSSNQGGSSVSGANRSGGGGYGYGPGYGGGAQGFGAQMWQPPTNFADASAGGRGAAASAADDKSAGLSNLSQGRASTLGDINEGEVSRVSNAELDSLDQTREPPVYVTYNRLHNLLIVRSGDEKLISEIAALIERIDRPARQVLLEVKVLELTNGDNFSSAFDLDFSSNGKGLSTSSGSQTTGAGIFEVFNTRIQARLELLQAQKRVRVLSTPLLMASNNQPSRLFIGTEQTLVTGVTSQTTTTSLSSSQATVTATTEQRDIGNQLIIVPRINDDRTVTLSIDQDTSTLNRGGASIPVTVSGNVVSYPIDTVSTANMQATVLAKDGYTAAVGGLIRDESSSQVQKVPLLGDIPMVGFFFRSQADVKSKTETVLLITPHIVETAEAAQSASRDIMDRRSEQAPAVVQDNLPALVVPAPAPDSRPPAGVRNPYYFEQMDPSPGAAPASRVPSGSEPMPGSTPQ